MGDTMGGGVMVAIAAALWIAYLLPSWLNRRQYIATERNAVRLQQTLRVLAETAETPQSVHLEATARAVASQERLLREHEATERARRRAAEQTAIAERRTAEQLARVATRAATNAGRARSRSLRRARGVASLVMLISLLVAIGGTVSAVLGSGWMLAAGGFIGFLAGLAGVVALARAATPVRPAVRASVLTEAPTQTWAPVELGEPEPVATWTPQPLPRPLASSRGTAAAVAMDSVEAAEKLRRAAVLAAISERAAQLNEAVPLRRPSRAEPVEQPAADSRFARMGIVDEAETAFSDLDSVLRRRRAG
ncbi:hypothetical protein E6C70_00660 [Glaciibacter flavus]|uniref:Large exoprotein n=1 Tax=Orlajensenia flava TaxID=2565934 RepID=A0A4S4FYG4_9MICO|nr:hypothetical protein [Glaciibacter flavus]THG36090.1 hypothetical protein E6C70_00660 [Glaciibacter flavus]